MSFITAVAVRYLPFLAMTVAFHSLAAGGYVYKTEYFTVPVDHFSFIKNDTFRMKYLINDTYWSRENGPIFFYAGNEAAIETFCDNTGYMWEIAEDFGAMLVFAEHRYYGVSMPYGSQSFDNDSMLGYLRSEQVLADYVDLLTYLRHNGSHAKVGGYDGDSWNTPTNEDLNGRRTRPSPVIVFGGSYGGMLATWIRIKYPAVVEGAIASSAPIWQFTGMTPCNAFHSVMSSAYMSTSAECGLTISASWKAIDHITKTNEGKSWLSRKWKLCTPLSDDIDVFKLKHWTLFAYGILAMVNYPYPANVLLPLPGYPMKELCKPMKNHARDALPLLKSVFKGLNVYFNYTGTSECLNVSSTYISITPGMAWKYQKCTELVIPMCSDGINDIFEYSTWNSQDFSDYCFHTFGVRPVVDFVEKTYGGKNLIAASNIIFSNGLLDPWSSGGVLQTISKTVRAVVMPESAHHLDLRASNVLDPASVIKTRKFHKKWIKKWIARYWKHPVRNLDNSTTSKSI